MRPTPCPRTYPHPATAFRLVSAPPYSLAHLLKTWERGGHAPQRHQNAAHTPGGTPGTAESGGAEDATRSRGRDKGGRRRGEDLERGRESEAPRALRGAESDAPRGGEVSPTGGVRRHPSRHPKRGIKPPKLWRWISLERVRVRDVQRQ